MWVHHSSGCFSSGLYFTGKHRRLRRKSLLLSHVVLFRWHGIACPFGTIRFEQQTRKWADANNDD